MQQEQSGNGQADAGDMRAKAGNRLAGPQQGETAVKQKGAQDTRKPGTLTACRHPRGRLIIKQRFHEKVDSMTKKSGDQASMEQRGERSRDFKVIPLEGQQKTRRAA
jgi:hypothetical protein